MIIFLLFVIALSTSYIAYLQHLEYMENAHFNNLMLDPHWADYDSELPTIDLEANTPKTVKKSKKTK